MDCVVFGFGEVGRQVYFLNCFGYVIQGRFLVLCQVDLMFVYGFFGYVVFQEFGEGFNREGGVGVFVFGGCFVVGVNLGLGSVGDFYFFRCFIFLVGRFLVFDFFVDDFFGMFDDEGLFIFFGGLGVVGLYLYVVVWCDQKVDLF